MTYLKTPRPRARSRRRPRTSSGRSSTSSSSRSTEAVRRHAVPQGNLRRLHARGSSLPVHGEGLLAPAPLPRRRAPAIVGSYFANVLSPPRRSRPRRRRRSRAPPATCIFVFMAGAPSHSDTWDLKEGAWTPAAFAPTSFGGSIRFAQGLMPNDRRAARTSSSSCAPSSPGRPCTASRRRGRRSRATRPASSATSPRTSARSSRSSRQAQRKPGDILPGLRRSRHELDDRARATCRPATRRSSCRRSRRDGLPSVKPNAYGGAAASPSATRLLQTLDTDRAPGAPLGDVPGRHGRLLRAGQGARGQPHGQHDFSCTAADYARYGSTRSEARRSSPSSSSPRTRAPAIIQLTVGGWDNHANIYAANGGPLHPDEVLRPGDRHAARRPRGGARRRRPARRSSTRRSS